MTPYAPIAIAIPVVVTREVLLPRRAIRHDLQWLVDTAQQVLCVVRAHCDQRRDVLFYMRRREPTHEVQHRIDEVAHDCR